MKDYSFHKAANSPKNGIFLNETQAQIHTITDPLNFLPE